MNSLDIGRTVEIKPAFNSETGLRDVWDEYAGCEAEILRVDGSDALLFVKAIGEVWIHETRIPSRRIA